MTVTSIPVPRMIFMEEDGHRVRGRLSWGGKIWIDLSSACAWTHSRSSQDSASRRSRQSISSRSRVRRWPRRTLLGWWLTTFPATVSKCETKFVRRIHSTRLRYHEEEEDHVGAIGLLRVWHHGWSCTLALLRECNALNFFGSRELPSSKFH